MSFVDAYGTTTTLRTDPYRDTEVDGQTVRDEIDYTSNDSDYVDPGPVTGLTEELITNPGESQTVNVLRYANYTYYGESGDSDPATFVSSHGTKGDLRSAEVTDSDGNPISTDFYVYYTGGDDLGYVHSDPDEDTSSVVGYDGGLKYVFSSQSYAKLVASLPSGTTIDEATDAEMQPYADDYIQYNADHQVSQISIQGQGCSSCGGGIGTYQYTYANNGYDSTYGLGDALPDFNAWSHETTETLPDGNTNIVYSNYYGEPILSVYEDTATNPTSPDQWRTAYRYDDAGRIIMAAEPSAVSESFSLPDAATDAAYTADNDGAYLDNETNLLGYDATTGDYANILDDQGSVQLSEYYGDATSPVTGGSTTVTEGNDTLAGGAAGYLEQT